MARKRAKNSHANKTDAGAFVLEYFGCKRGGEIMNAAEVIEIVREGIYVLIMISAPLMLVALIVGLAIALLQALTQIQEATLTFVPKVLAMLIMLTITLPYMLQTLMDYTIKLQEKIVHIE